MELEDEADLLVAERARSASFSSDVSSPSMKTRLGGSMVPPSSLSRAGRSRPPSR